MFIYYIFIDVFIRLLFITISSCLHRNGISLLFIQVGVNEYYNYLLNKLLLLILINVDVSYYKSIMFYYCNTLDTYFIYYLYNLFNLTVFVSSCYLFFF